MSDNKWDVMNPNVAITPKQQYEQTVKNLDLILTYRQDFMLCFAGGADRIENGYRYLKEVIKDILDDKVIKVEPYQQNLISDVTNITLDKLMMGEISKLLIDFTNNINILIVNWNNNTIKNNDISRKVQLTDRMLKDRKTMEDTTYILQTLIQRAKRYSESEPKSFELSKHYLKALEANKGDNIAKP